MAHVLLSDLRSSSVILSACCARHWHWHWHCNGCWCPEVYSAAAASAAAAAASAAAAAAAAEASAISRHRLPAPPAASVVLRPPRHRLSPVPQPQAKRTVILFHFIAAFPPRSNPFCPSASRRRMPKPLGPSTVPSTQPKFARSNAWTAASTCRSSPRPPPVDASATSIPHSQT